ncbi:DUF6456 domain-containing protein [Aureimonas mangrovi]|uniref:DUF6456 domain-containing protein n=1 Tax=Aureimonas mangrovi TaxID=2758041 RepID=UPI00163DC649|nr:DUF6456 domain-containing protein [Aureimonas mangrovi]
MSGPEFDDAESPLHRLATRPARGGEPFLSPSEARAGERLRGDFTRAGLTPRITQSWDLSPRAGGRGGGAGDMSDMAADARKRLDAAMTAAGPELSGLLLDVCCFLKGLEAVERERRWPARSAKLLLKVGLAGLARHYGFDREAGSLAAGRIRRWGAPDYKPKVGG